MAINYIIGGIQLMAAVINLLALGSFWVTPGLRTTANRFVINLLIVNIVGCVALVPALWLHGGHRSNLFGEPDQNLELCNTTKLFDEYLQRNKAASSPVNLFEGFAKANVRVRKSTKTFLRNGCLQKNDGQDCEHPFSEQQKSLNDEIAAVDVKQVAREREPIGDNAVKCVKYSQNSDCSRFWGLDLAAALGNF